MSVPLYDSFRRDEQKPIKDDWVKMQEVSQATLELIEARKRARLSVLKLTDKDRRLLKEMKIAI